jgi:hypothetical protein
MIKVLERGWEQPEGQSRTQYHKSGREYMLRMMSILLTVSAYVGGGRGTIKTAFWGHDI